MRILLAEDEALVALDFQMEAEDRGIGDVVAVPSVAQGLDALADTRFDWGVLDLNLKDGQTFGLADQLIAQGARICFISGERIEPTKLEHYGARAFGKPVPMAVLWDHLLTQS
ncbi:hypothetical protein [Dinoroseobacter sp. S375]|uniref:hypothetical protein n=1 Tax=Dinoroseobacter sp. S375 TaxID=3415136 RepID=UPI003C79DEAE